MRSLVATVGTNPMPVLLSCLTHAEQGLDQVVLVHSAATAFGPRGTGPTAERVESSLQRLLPDLHDLSRINLGTGVSASDIDGVEAALHANVDDLVNLDDEDELLLDYTGGTKAMTAAAVKWHLDMTAGSDTAAERRFYVDETLGMIRPDQGDPLSLKAPTELNLAEMAALHGLTLAVSEQPSRADEQEAFQWCQAAVAAHESRPECSVCRSLGIDPGPGVGEVLLNQEVGEAATGQWQRWASQFDVLVRWGHRVVAIEAKTHNGQFFVSAGWAYARTRAAFGGSAHPWFLTTRHGQSAPSLSGMRDHVAWTGIDPGQVSLNWMHQHKPEAAASFHHFFPARPYDTAARQHVARSATAPRGGLVVVSAVGSARMAPAAAVRLAAATSDAALAGVELLTSPQYRQGEAMELENTLAALTAGARIPVRRRQVDLGAAGEVAHQVTTILDRAAKAGARVVLDGTAGPKAVTAGMVIAAAGRDTVPVVCTDVRQRLRSTAGGGVTAAPLVAMPFDVLLSPTYRPHPIEALPSSVPGELHRLAGMVVAHIDRTAAPDSSPATVWVPFRLPGVGGSHQLSLVIVAAWDRLIGLVQAPDRFVHTPDGEPLVTTHREIADFAATGALYLDALAGDATRTVVVYRRTPTDDRPNEERTLRSRVESRLALAHPAAERPIRVCLFQESGQPDPDTDQVLGRLVRDLYLPQTAPAGSTSARVGP